MNAELLDSLGFSATVFLPNILMLLLGIFLRNRRLIDDKFCDQASRLVFNVTLPLLLFLGIATNPINYHTQALSILVGVLTTLLLFFGAEFIAAKMIPNRKERGIFVQGVFRGNTGIMGLSLCANAYGTAGLAAAAVYVALITLLYNVLAVLTLTRSLSEQGKTNILAILKSLIKNPLIIAIIIALFFNKMHFSLPKPLLSTANYLANITLPLALLCAGASLNFRGLFSTSAVSVWSSIGRVIIAPLVIVFMAKAMGLEGMSLGIIYLVSATPVASASYVMTRSMGGNATIAANIIGLTTIGSLFISAIGIVILSQLGWM
ncbi:AEC family transporter [Conservatibacter flavescens]|uniref:Malonate transporter n=1 Tax=Conservatibacter flavescens TaxID=28161 RepID=A0A2M8S0I2_9PAST|nr:AEC family transporter [Conservatibacter flavescens]PJG84662.1 malonate transporter [Conservatibacter flavescens]